MLRFSLCALFGIVLLAAIACAVVLAFPAWLRVATLSIGVLALPGPLVVMLRYGGKGAKSFALGGLAAYVVWLVVVGVPTGFAMMRSNDPVVIRSVVQMAEVPLSEIFKYTVESGYVLLGVLYAPWLVVMLAGLASLVVYRLISADV